MAAIQTEIYDAFIDAGAKEPKARAAAQVIADYPKPEELATTEYIDRRIEKLEERTDRKFAEMKAEMAEMKAEIMRALWLQGSSIVGIMVGCFIVAITILK